MDPDSAELVKLRTAVRECEASLKRVDELEAVWGRYVDSVRKSVIPVPSNKPPISLEAAAAQVQSAELERLKFVSMLPTCLASYSNRALVDLTSHNLVTQRSSFLMAICRIAYTGPDGTEYVTLGEDGPEYAVSVERFEAKVNEVKALFDAKRWELGAGRDRHRAMLEEMQNALAETRKHELAVAQASAPTIAQLLRKTKPVRLIAWAFQDPLKKTISSALLAAAGIYLIPPLRELVVGFWRRIFPGP